MSRKKQEKVKNVANEDAAFNNNIEEFSDIEEHTEGEMVTKEVTDKRFGIVTLVTNKYVVYDLNGNSIYKRGKFNYSIGDKIEV